MDSITTRISRKPRQEVKIIFTETNIFETLNSENGTRLSLALYLF